MKNVIYKIKHRLNVNMLLSSVAFCHFPVLAARYKRYFLQL